MAKKNDIMNNHTEESTFQIAENTPPKTNWWFVFVTPGREVDVKRTSAVEKFLQGVKLYLAHLEIE
jgi:hypothetical protein